MRFGVLMLVLAGCPADTDTETDTNGETDDTVEPDPAGNVWEVVADNLTGGVMLAASTLGDEMVISGGSYGNTGSLWRFSDNELCVEENVAEAALWWVHSRSENDWYAVGETGIIVHEVDGVRTREDLPTDDLTIFGVYDDGTDVWAVGGNVRTDQTGEIWRKADGGDWALEATTDGLAFKVWEGWVVGAGFVWWWDGTEFVDRTPEGGPRLLTVRGRSQDDVWVVGGLQNPEFWHWNGTGWEQPELDPACVNQPLNGVYTEPDDDVWVAGNFGNAANLDESWSCASFPVTANHFHATWRFGDDIFMVGGNLTSTSNHFGTVVRYASEDAPDVTVTGACP
jgi:hypothetical protein